MPRRQDIPQILDTIRQRIAQERIPLVVTGDKLEDDWLTVIVQPNLPDVRASEYAEFMTRVERELRNTGFDEVVLVPALAS